MGGLSFQRLRNRSAHHEPIFNGVTVAGTNHVISIPDLWDQTVELLEWMSPDLGALHRTAAQVPNLCAAKP